MSMIETPPIDSFSDLSDAPHSYIGQASKHLAVNPSETGIELVAPGGGGGTWGSITGTLSDQTDLITALNAKADLTHTHDAADINVLGTVPGIYDPGDLETTLQSIGNSVAAITGGGITNEQSIVNAIIFG